MLGEQFKAFEEKREDDSGFTHEGSFQMLPVRRVFEDFTHEEGPMSKKLRESRQHRGPYKDDPLTLHEQLQASGTIRQPIHCDLGGEKEGVPHLMDGHHRTAAMYDVEPDTLVPVYIR